MTVGQSENIEIKILAFIISVVLSVIFSPFILLALFFHYVGLSLIWLLERVRDFKMYLLEKYIQITNMPKDGMRKAVRG